MVDCALHAMQEILADHPEALLYGQDVGGRLGGVFREAATLAQKFGDQRVFNTPIQEAFIIGSTAGMSAAGLRPIVEVQFADYLWPGLISSSRSSAEAISCQTASGPYTASSAFPSEPMDRAAPTTVRASNLCSPTSGASRWCIRPTAPT